MNCKLLSLKLYISISTYCDKILIARYNQDDGIETPKLRIGFNENDTTGNLLNSFISFIISLVNIKKNGIDMVCYIIH